MDSSPLAIVLSARRRRRRRTAMIKNPVRFLPRRNGGAHSFLIKWNKNLNFSLPPTTTTQPFRGCFRFLGGGGGRNVRFWILLGRSSASFRLANDDTTTARGLELSLLFLPLQLPRILIHHHHYFSHWLTECYVLVHHHRHPPTTATTTNVPSGKLTFFIRFLRFCNLPSSFDFKPFLERIFISLDFLFHVLQFIPFLLSSNTLKENFNNLDVSFGSPSRWPRLSTDWSAGEKPTDQIRRTVKSQNETETGLLSVLLPNHPPHMWDNVSSYVPMTMMRRRRWLLAEDVDRESRTTTERTRTVSMHITSSSSRPSVWPSPPWPSFRNPFTVTCVLCVFTGEIPNSIAKTSFPNKTTRTGGV